MLRTLVARSAQCLRRTSDWLVRTGADEFMIVLPETNLECAEYRGPQAASRSYSATPVRTAAGPVNFTVSINATAIEATHPVTGSSVVEEFLRAPERRVASASDTPNRSSSSRSSSWHFRNSKASVAYFSPGY